MSNDPKFDALSKKIDKMYSILEKMSGSKISTDSYNQEGTNPFNKERTLEDEMHKELNAIFERGNKDA